VFTTNGDAVDNLDVNNAGFFGVAKMLITTVPLLIAYMLVFYITKEKDPLQKDRGITSPKGGWV